MFYQNNEILTEPHQIANYFNDYFSNIGTNITSDINNDNIDMTYQH